MFASAFPAEAQNFREYLEKRLTTLKFYEIRPDGKTRQITRKLNDICPVDSDTVAERVFREYGAIFIAEGITFPSKCVFRDETDVANYHRYAKSRTAVIGGVEIELQEAAMNALEAAVKEAAKRNLRITPRGGSDAAKRTYATTERLWNSRFYPALNHWVRKGAISRRDAEDAKAMPINEQVAQVLAWESKRLWFSKDLSKSILYSVAAPGASQHIFMLALDVEQFANKQVRDILASHGWYQTVKSDLPHFTYLGIMNKNDLPNYGLKRETASGQEFWIPNLD